MSLREAKIPVTDWGYRRSDVTCCGAIFNRTVVAPIGLALMLAIAVLYALFQRYWWILVRKALLVLTGTGIRDTREVAPSATQALRMVCNRMKLRGRGVQIEVERGNPVSSFQLKEMAELEARKNTARTWRRMVSDEARSCASFISTKPLSTDPKPHLRRQVVL
jgi:hypothetical protein